MIKPLNNKRFKELVICLDEIKQSMKETKPEERPNIDLDEVINIISKMKASSRPKEENLVSSSIVTLWTVEKMPKAMMQNPRLEQLCQELNPSELDLSNQVRQNLTGSDSIARPRTRSAKPTK